MEKGVHETGVQKLIKSPKKTRLVSSGLIPILLLCLRLRLLRSSTYERSKVKKHLIMTIVGLFLKLLTKIILDLKKSANMSHYQRKSGCPVPAKTLFHALESVPTVFFFPKKALTGIIAGVLFT